MKLRSLFASAALVSISALACGSPSARQASLAVSATSSAVTTTTGGSTSIDLGNGLTVDRIRVVVRKLKLETTSSGSENAAAPTASRSSASRGADDHSGSSGNMGSDDGASSSGSSSSGGPGSDDGSTEVEREHDDGHEPVVGPLLADITAASLAGGVQQIFQGSVPDGTFRELKFSIGPITTAQAGSDAGLAAMASQGASIIIDGAVDGKPFSFVSSLTAQFQLEGTFSSSDASLGNLTLSFDPAAWFSTGAARLDPSDPASKPAIEDRIRTSIQCFEDDDRNGHDDRGEVRGGQDDGAGHT